MRYVLQYNWPITPSDAEVLDMVLAVTQASGNECESVELQRDMHVAPGFAFLVEQENDEEWKGE